MRTGHSDGCKSQFRRLAAQGPAAPCRASFRCAPQRSLHRVGDTTSHLKASGFLVGCTHQRRDVSHRLAGRCPAVHCLAARCDALLRHASQRPSHRVEGKHLTSKLLAFWWVVPTNSLCSVARSTASLRHVTHRAATPRPPTERGHSTHEELLNNQWPFSATR